MSIKEIFIFRHGETDWNREGRFQGHLDIPINNHGREQALSLVPLIREHSVEAILSSDLQRAYETGRIVAESLGLPIFTDTRLREAHLGEAQGLSYEEIEARFGSALMGRWRSSQPTDADICYPGGETGAQIMKRVFGALEQFLGEQPFERIGVATHGGVIRRVMQRILPPDHGAVPIPNVVLYRLRYDLRSRGWELHR